MGGRPSIEPRRDDPSPKHDVIPEPAVKGVDNDAPRSRSDSGTEASPRPEASQPQIRPTPPARSPAARLGAFDVASQSSPKFAGLVGLAFVLAVLVAVTFIPRLGTSRDRTPSQTSPPKAETNPSDSLAAVESPDLPKPQPAVPVEPPTADHQLDRDEARADPGGRVPDGLVRFGQGCSNDEMPQHRVRITRPFYLGVTEVTQGQYRAVTGQSPSKFKGSDDLPVEQVSWLDAVKFCNAAEPRGGPHALLPGRRSNVSVPDWKGAGYRLPTEAEWEYACRAKNPARYSFGDDPAGLGEYAWFDGNSGNQTHPVGQKRPNAFGLFDMHGNVWEWCWDGFDAKYYAESPVDDPRGPSGASVRVIRGGSWGGNPRDCAVGVPGLVTPGDRRDNLGFRLARVQSGR